jgi:hypothetical protein
MPQLLVRPTQKLAVVALFTEALYFVMSQSYFSDGDEKLTAVLSWSHYNAALPRIALWYTSTALVLGMVIALIGVASNRRWGRWLLLFDAAASLLLTTLSGLFVATANARLFGGLAMACVFAILALSFLAKNE